MKNVFFKFLTHQWPYKFNKPQWSHHGLSDRVSFSKTFYTWTSMTIPRSHRPGFFLTQTGFFFNPVCETMVWSLTFRVKNVFEKKRKKPGLWDRGMVTGGLGQKPDWKKMTGLSDSDLVTGRLNFSNTFTLLKMLCEFLVAWYFSFRIFWLCHYKIYPRNIKKMCDSEKKKAEGSIHLLML